MPDHDPDMTDSMRKIVESERRARGLLDRWDAAKEATKAAKEAYEDAVASTMALIRESSRTYPLFEGRAGESVAFAGDDFGRIREMESELRDGGGE